MFKYIISYDGGQLRDSGDFEWGLFNSYGEAEEEANNAKEEYMRDWNIEGSEYDPDEVVECVLYEPLEHATLIFVSIVEPYYTAMVKEIKW